jgi:frataxin-like iron-binding protein CyaY
MTSGYPTDATETAVQANIVSAGYAGDSSGGSAGGGGGLVPEPPGPYTGPSDPNGPGPQDGFASPAAEQPNDVMATKPGLASFNGSLYVAFQGVNVNNDLYVTSSSTGNNFPMATQYTNLQSSSAPAMAAFNNQLFMAFRGLNVDNDFYITSSSTGSNFPTATRYTNIQMGGAPALAVFDNQLCAAFQAADTGHTLHVTCSSDGVNWPTAWQVPNVAIGSDPAMSVLNGILYIAFRANDPSNDVWIASSADGHTFSSQVLTGQTMGGNSTPALVASRGVLYYIYGANDSNNEMLVSASTDGATWQGPAAYLGLQMGPLGPGATEFANGVSVGFQSNDSRNVLFITNKVTEAPTYTGPTDGGTGGLQDGFTPAAAIQPNDIMGSKPALAAFRANLFAAFKGLGGNNSLYVTSSPTGSNFPTATQYANILMSSAPAIAQFNNQLYVAFRGLGVNNDLYITSSPTGSNFPTATQYTNIQMGGTPAMALFNNQLYIAFQANDAGHTLHVTSSSDGVNWPAAWQVANVAIGSDPAMTVFNGMLYIAFRANDPSNDVWIASSSDGVNFTSQVLSGQTMAWGSSPALAVVNQNDGNYLYYIYEANDAGHEMLVSTSTDGSTWQSPALYSNINMGATGPAATGFGNTTYVGFQSNDARKVLFVTSQPVSGQSAVGGYYLPNSTFYPRLVRLSHGPTATNGNVVASTDGNIFVSNQGSAPFVFTGTVPSQYGYHLGSGTLYELPQTVGSLQAGTLLYAATYYYGSGRNTAIEVNTSTDGGNTWQYSSMPVSGAGFLGDGFWEPQFTVADDGALVMFWSDETDSCCSQKLSQIRTYNGTTWQDKTNTVASGIQADRPGMAVVTKLPSGVYFMSYELCGPASCTAVYRTSTDGWNFGTPGNTGTKIQTASGQYFQHAPTNVWSPSSLGINGALLLMGQQMFDNTGVVDPNSGSQMFVNLSSDGSGPWYTIAAPVTVPNPANDYCPNYSTALLPAADGSSIFELASGYNNNNQCVSFTTSESWNNLPTDGFYYALENQHPDLCLDGGSSSSNPAILSACTDSNGVYNKYWQVHSQGRGWFTIQSETSGLCVDNAGGSNTPGNKVVVWTCTANDMNQNWQFMDLANGQFKLLNQAGQLNLDDTGGSTAPGTQLQIWIDNSLDAQHWVLH